MFESRQNFHWSTVPPSCVPTHLMFFQRQFLKKPWRQLTGACFRSRISLKTLFQMAAKSAMAAPWKPEIPAKVQQWLPVLMAASE